MSIKNLALLCLFIFSIVILSIFTFGMIGPKETADSPEISLPKESGKTWVQIDPVQCLGNPWEIDWTKSHDNDYYGYPADIHTPELEQEEIQIIKNYYQKQGIAIADVRSEWTHEIVCTACNCPQGYMLYLLVSDSDVDKMLELDYEVSAK
ncbi:MAG: hypothetical protein PHI66_03185 [Candidatus Pacebacteria bacterium]|nr:hypothetical protein [Candidatus Paceibacterota bacterium]